MSPLNIGIYINVGKHIRLNKGVIIEDLLYQPHEKSFLFTNKNEIKIFFTIILLLFAYQNNKTEVLSAALIFLFYN